MSKPWLILSYNPSECGGEWRTPPKIVNNLTVVHMFKHQLPIFMSLFLRIKIDVCVATPSWVLVV
jgi:hypothetical protein